MRQETLSYFFSFSLVFYSFRTEFSREIARMCRTGTAGTASAHFPIFALSKRDRGCLTLLTSQHGREVRSVVAEIVGGSEAAGER